MSHLITFFFFARSAKLKFFNSTIDFSPFLSPPTRITAFNIIFSLYQLSKLLNFHDLDEKFYFHRFYLFCLSCSCALTYHKLSAATTFQLRSLWTKERKKILAVFFRIALFNFNCIEKALIHLITIVGSTAQSKVRNLSFNQCFLSVDQQKLSERKKKVSMENY